MASPILSTTATISPSLFLTRCFPEATSTLPVQQRVPFSST